MSIPRIYKLTNQAKGQDPGDGAQPAHSEPPEASGRPVSPTNDPFRVNENTKIQQENPPRIIENRHGPEHSAQRHRYEN